MKLTPTQLALMERSDKTLGSGCMIEYECSHNGCFPVGGGSGEVDYYDDMLIGVIGCVHRDVFIENNELYLRLEDYDIDESSGELIEINKIDQLAFWYIKQENGERKKQMKYKELEDKKRREMRHSGELKTEKQRDGFGFETIDGKYSCLKCFERSLNYRGFAQIENARNEELFTLTSGEIVALWQFMESPNIIGHPYGWERLAYLQSIAPVELFDTYYKQWEKLCDYVWSGPELMLKSCIDRPEEGQTLVLDFLNTLPKGN